MKQSQFTYFREFDSLRFFAFSFVFLAHSFYSKDPLLNTSDLYLSVRAFFRFGGFGVNFFFVLSGFLITHLLFEEKQFQGDISLKNFYVRRILRIWPLYIVILIIGFMAIPIIQHSIGNPSYTEKAVLWPFLLFVNNFFPAPSSATLGVLWSIAIEEQFYIVWPFVVKFLSPKKVVIVCVLIILYSLIWRTFIVHDWGYQHTISCASDLSFGALTAYFFKYRLSSFNWLKNLSKTKIILIYLSGFSFFIFRSEIGTFLSRYDQIGEYFYLNQRLIFSLFFAFVLMEQTLSKNSVIKFSSLKPIDQLGKYTYGLYMYHFTIIYMISKIIRILIPIESEALVFIYEPLSSLTLTIMVSLLSYKYLEKPILSFKNNFR